MAPLIQYVDWQLTWQKQQIADSESKRHLMQAAVERLESKTLKKVMHHPSDRTTSFIFSGDVELKCQAYSDSAADEHCWSLYTPDMHVLFADRSGKLHYVRSDLGEGRHSSTAEHDEMAEA
jgi:hypothetical protein